MKAVHEEVVGSYILIHSQREREQDVLGLLWAFQTSNLIPQWYIFFSQKAKLTPTRPHLLILLMLHKECHSLMTKISKLRAYGSHSYANHNKQEYLFFFHANKKKINFTEFLNFNMMSCLITAVTVMYTWTIWKQEDFLVCHWECCRWFVMYFYRYNKWGVLGGTVVRL